MKWNFQAACNRLIRKTVAGVYPAVSLEGIEKLPQEPCVLIGNHAQAHGPIISETRLPFPHYTWCAWQMMRREAVAQYAFADFWSGKPAAVRWIYWIISRMIPGLAAYVFTNANTIPVYRDMRCMATYKKSVEKLEQGNHLVIFPECAQGYNSIVNEFQTGFVDLARIYYKRTGKALRFVPVYLAPKLHKVFFCDPIAFHPEAPIAQERQRICQELKDAITKIAQEQPCHIVVPYLNIPRKAYPTNIPQEEVQA